VGSQIWPPRIKEYQILPCTHAPCSCRGPLPGGHASVLPAIVQIEHIVRRRLCRGRASLRENRVATNHNLRGMASFQLVGSSIAAKCFGTLPYRGSKRACRAAWLGDDLHNLVAEGRRQRATRNLVAPTRRRRVDGTIPLKDCYLELNVDPRPASRTCQIRYSLVGHPIAHKND
jgi:hypothetical protein